MIYHITDLAARVAALLGDPSVARRLEAPIEACIGRVALRVMEPMPLRRLTERRTLPDRLYSVAGRPGVFRIPVPDDFWRPVSIRLDVWMTDVTEIIEPGDSRYSLRNSTNPGVAGGADSPAVYRVGHPAGDRLELHGVNPESDRPCLVTGEYVPYPAVYDRCIRLPAGCADDVVAALASELEDTALRLAATADDAADDGGRPSSRG